MIESPRFNAASPSGICLRGCCPVPFLAKSLSENHHVIPTPGSAAESRYEFVIATLSSLFPETEFTNHESLPSLQQAFSYFNKAYPRYSQTDVVDQIRDSDYHHLSVSKHVCLDYIGHGLFSYSQIRDHTPILFDICHKPTNFSLMVTELELMMKRRIMAYMNMLEDDYDLFFTTNQSSAFKIVAESYPFHSNKNLVSAYDYKNEALEIMIEIAKNRGGRVSSAEFSWPKLRIHSEKLKKKIVSKGKKKRGLFVFPLQSRVTGTRYSYQWMNLAKENGWHILLDASSLGPKEMDTLGLFLFKPDFLFSSFYKIFGDDPSGFGCLFVRKSSMSLLNNPATALMAGMVSLRPSNYLKESLTDDIESKQRLNRDEQHLSARNDETCESSGTKEKLGNQKVSSFSEIEELDTAFGSAPSTLTGQFECRGLDDADSIGLIRINCRARCLINWLVNAMMRLKHPNRDNGISPVRIYGPKIKFDRGPIIAFNLFDWKGEKVEPALVQKLADRNNISVSCGFLQHVVLSDKHEEEKEGMLETENLQCGISVVSLSLALLTNFEDVYRVWVFVSRFLDADFVEKGRWRYKALNQQTIVI
ncbi:hypothetical protein ACFE04_016179 [Oxalis oulophora]